MNTEPLERAIKIAGGQRALGGLIGVKQQNVWSWLHRSGRVPAEYCLPIEQATGVPAVELRPDVFGVKSPDTAA